MPEASGGLTRMVLAISVGLILLSRHLPRAGDRRWRGSPAQSGDGAAGARRRTAGRDARRRLRVDRRHEPAAAARAPFYFLRPWPSHPGSFASTTSAASSTAISRPTRPTRSAARTRRISPSTAVPRRDRRRPRQSAERRALRDALVRRTHRGRRRRRRHRRRADAAQLLGAQPSCPSSAEFRSPARTIRRSTTASSCRSARRRCTATRSSGSTSSRSGPRRRRRRAASSAKSRSSIATSTTSAQRIGKLSRPIRAVYDCGNGAGALVAPQPVRATRPAKGSRGLFCESDGTFPNHHPDPTVPENLEDLIRAVREDGAEIGIAFDGDADRIGVVDGRRRDRLGRPHSDSLRARRARRERARDSRSSST